MSAETAQFQILVAEDNAADVLLVREAFKEHQLDCTVLVIADGSEVIAFLERLDRNPTTPGLDLILLDMHLPRCDGGDILRCIGLSERSAETPIIVMSSSELPFGRETVGKPVALHYFNKSSSLREFMLLGVLVREILFAQPPGSAQRKRGSAA